MLTFRVCSSPHQDRLFPFRSTYPPMCAYVLYLLRDFYGKKAHCNPSWRRSVFVTVVIVTLFSLHFSLCGAVVASAFRRDLVALYPLPQ